MAAVAPVVLLAAALKDLLLTPMLQLPSAAESAIARMDYRAERGI